MKSSDGELIVPFRNGGKVQVKHIGNISLCLFTRHVLELKNVVYVSFIRRNLILVIVLGFDGYSYSFGNKKFDILYDSYVVSFDTLSYGLHKITLDLDFAKSINITTRKKRIRIDESSLML